MRSDTTELLWAAVICLFFWLGDYYAMHVGGYTLVESVSVIRDMSAVSCCPGVAARRDIRSLQGVRSFQLERIARRSFEKSGNVRAKFPLEANPRSLQGVRSFSIERKAASAGFSSEAGAREMFGRNNFSVPLEAILYSFCAALEWQHVEGFGEARQFRDSVGQVSLSGNWH